MVDANVMLLPDDGEFHFKKWPDLKNTDAKLMQLLTNGTNDAAQRYSDTVEAKPRELGGLLTIATAVRDITLADLTSPLSFYWEVMWDLLAPDRFWAWVEVGLADKIQKLAELDAFAAEADPGHWHPGNRTGSLPPREAGSRRGSMSPTCNSRFMRTIARSAPIPTAARCSAW